MLKLAEGETFSAVSMLCLTTAYAVADRLMWQGCDLERYGTEAGGVFGVRC